jgi:hypothetical protein
MTLPILFARDGAGLNTFAPMPSVDMYSATLAAGGSSSITLPTNAVAWLVSFSYTPGSNVWVSYSTSGASSASGPAGASFASTTSELLPGARRLPSTVVLSSGTNPTVIYFKNTGANSADVGVILYAVS